MKPAVAAICAITAISASFAFADDARPLKVREAMANSEAKLAEEVAYTNSVCGTTLAASFDWSGFSNDDVTGNYSVVGYCDAALQGLEATCGSALGKEAVQQKVTSVVCAKAATRAIELKDKSLVFSIQWDSANDADAVKEFLGNNL